MYLSFAKNGIPTDNSSLNSITIISEIWLAIILWHGVQTPLFLKKRPWLFCLEHPDLNSTQSDPGQTWLYVIPTFSVWEILFCIYNCTDCPVWTGRNLVFEQFGVVLPSNQAGKHIVENMLRD